MGPPFRFSGLGIRMKGGRSRRVHGVCVGGERKKGNIVQGNLKRDRGGQNEGGDEKGK